VVLWALAVSALGAGGELPAIVAELSIELQEAGPDGLDWQALSRALLGFTEGQRLTGDRLEQGVSALRTWAEVDYRIDPSADGEVRLTLGVRSLKRIKKISVNGNHPLFERDVLNAMTIGVGEPLRPSVLVAQEALIQQRYQAEGYIAPRTHIDWSPDPDDGHYCLRIAIDKGDYYRLGAVRFQGNRVFGEYELRLRLLDWSTVSDWIDGDRFIERQFQETIQKLTAFYRRQGYCDAVVSSRLTADGPNRRMDAVVEIEEGLRYSVNLVGNQHFSSSDLKNELALFEIGNRGNVGVRRSLNNIRQRYLRSGFAEVAVRSDQRTEATGGGEGRAVTIHIEEGPRSIVERVEIYGNAKIAEEAIREQMLTRPAGLLEEGAYSAEVMAEDLAAVHLLYLNRGYSDVEVNPSITEDPRTGRVVIGLNIHEGPIVRVGAIRFSDATPLGEDGLRAGLPFKSGDSFNPQAVQAGADEISAQLSALGYAHAQVEQRATFTPDRSTAVIDYLIDKGPLVKIGEIFYAGNFATRNHTLEREMEVKSGAPFSMAEVLKSQRNIRNLNIFDSVRLRTLGLKERSETVHMLFEVVERNPYYWELGGGYQSDKGPYARTKIGDRNFLGRGQELWSGAEVSDVGYRWDIGIVEPRLFDTRIASRLGLFTEKQELYNQDFGTEARGGNLALTRALGEKIAMSLGTRYEHRRQFLRDEDAQADPEELAPRNILVVTPSIRYDSRDSFIRPRRGALVSFGVDFSSGLEKSLDNFIRYKFDLRRFYSPRPDLTLAALGRVGYLTAYGDNNALPEDQLFFLGGISDVRGYGENLLRYDAEGNPVGGRLAINASLEARYDLWHDFELAAFVDTGTLRETIDPVKEDEDFRWSVGLGLRYLTPIGPIGLIYGHKLDPRPGESPGQWHITFGYTF
jgi:outer membrane protein insertion porin family